MMHAEALDGTATDWARIVGLYDILARLEPSPVVELNRAVAVTMRDGPEADLALIDSILARGDLESYHLAHAAREVIHDLPGLSCIKWRLRFIQVRGMLLAFVRRVSSMFSRYRN